MRRARSAAGTGSPEVGAPLFDSAMRRVAAVVVLGTIMSILDSTIVNVAIDSLGRDFHTTVTTIQWVVTGYLLALGVVIPLTSWAIEQFGAKRAWMSSLALFLVGSILCGAAPSTSALIGFRILQGIGGGMILPIGQTILAREAGPNRIGRVMTVIGVPSLLGPVLGPVVGGLILVDLSWRWIFFVNVPIGIVALVLAWRILGGDDRSAHRVRLDLVGFLLASPGLALVVYGLSEAGTTGGFGQPLVLVGLVLGAVLVVVFVLRALRVRAPLVDVRLLARRSVAFSAMTSFLLAGSLFGATFLIPLYYQVDRGQSALTAGLLMAPQGIGAMLVMPLAGRITDRAGARRVVPFGIVVAVLATAAYTQVTPHTSEALLALTLFGRGVGLGASIMPAVAAAYRSLGRAEVPNATTLMNILQRIGATLGTAIVAVVLQQRIAAALPGAPVSLSSTPTTALPAAAASRLAGAFGQTFWVALVFAAICLVPALFLPRPAASASEPRAPVLATAPE